MTVKCVFLITEPKGGLTNSGTRRQTHQIIDDQLKFRFYCKPWSAEFCVPVLLQPGAFLLPEKKGKNRRLDYKKDVALSNREGGSQRLPEKEEP